MALFVPDSDLFLFDATTRAALAASAIFGATWQYRPMGRIDSHPFSAKSHVFCFWHSDMLPIFHFHQRSRMSAVVSTSRDGRRLAAVLDRWGYATIHGSSTRGGDIVMADAVRTLASGGNVAITPDGPRGPREQAKRGVARMAFLARAPIVPIAARPSRSFRLRSWDRFVIPLPFATIAMHYLDPIEPPPRGSEAEAVQALLDKVQKALASHGLATPRSEPQSMADTETP